MALYEEYPQNIRTKDAIDDTLNQYFRTNNKLIKDNGDNPSGKKLVDPDLKPLFKYHFGTKWGDKEAGAGLGAAGQGAGWVVLPKGRVVAVDPEIQRRDWDMEKMYNVLTICNGGYEFDSDEDDLMKEDSMRDYRAANKPAGIATINVYEDKEQSLTGNVPTYTTRANITLPLFASKEQAEATEWGSAYCVNDLDYDDPRDVDLEDLQDGLKPGDLVKSDEYGRITKWVEEDDDREQIIGRVDQVDTELIPQDFLKWVMPDVEGENVPELLLNKLGYASEDIIDSDFVDLSYADGYERNAYMPLGIPGLTDGMNIKIKQEEVELLSVDSTEVGDRLQLRVPADDGLYDPDYDSDEPTLKLYDQDEIDLLSEYDEGAMEAEGSTEIGSLGEVTVTGGEHEDYNFTVEFTDGASSPDEEATYDSGTVTVDLDSGESYDASDVEGYIQDLGTTDDIDFSEVTVTQEEDGETEDASVFVEETIELEGGQEEGPQRLEVVHTDPYNHLITVEVLDTQDTDDLTIYADFEATHALPGIPTELDWDGVVGSVDIVINL